MRSVGELPVLIVQLFLLHIAMIKLLLKYRNSIIDFIGNNSGDVFMYRWIYLLIGVN